MALQCPFGEGGYGKRKLNFHEHRHKNAKRPAECEPENRLRKMARGLRAPPPSSSHVLHGSYFNPNFYNSEDIADKYSHSPSWLSRRRSRIRDFKDFKETSGVLLGALTKGRKVM